MIDKIKNRMASEQGFTLIELLVVIIILGILVAIAVPAYLSFTDSAHTAAAQSNVRSAVPAAEDYYQTNSQLPGMTEAKMAALSPGHRPERRSLGEHCRRLVRPVRHERHEDLVLHRRQGRCDPGQRRHCFCGHHHVPRTRLIV